MLVEMYGMVKIKEGRRGKGVGEGRAKRKNERVMSFGDDRFEY